MLITCLQMIHMKHQALFSKKIKKDMIEKWQSASVLIGIWILNVIC